MGPESRSKLYAVEAVVFPMSFLCIYLIKEMTTQWKEDTRVMNMILPLLGSPTELRAEPTVITAMPSPVVAMVLYTRAGGMSGSSQLSYG